jgi:hypothetical protein
MPVPHFGGQKSVYVYIRLITDYSSVWSPNCQFYLTVNRAFAGNGCRAWRSRARKATRRGEPRGNFVPNYYEGVLAY